MLRKLKESKNKYYQFHEDYNTYQKRCKETDPTGYDVVFIDEENNSQGNIEIMSSNMQKVQDEILKEEEEDNSEQNDEADYEKMTLLRSTSSNTTIYCV